MVSDKRKWRWKFSVLRFWLEARWLEKGAWKLKYSALPNKFTSLVFHGPLLPLTAFTINLFPSASAQRKTCKNRKSILWRLQMILTQGQIFHYFEQPYNIILIVLPFRFCLHIIKVAFNQRKHEYGKKSLDEADPSKISAAPSQSFMTLSVMMFPGKLFLRRPKGNLK